MNFDVVVIFEASCCLINELTLVFTINFNLVLDFKNFSNFQKLNKTRLKKRISEDFSKNIKKQIDSHFLDKFCREIG